MPRRARRARWSGRIGFHQGAPNPLLVAHAAALGAGPRRVLVPLYGKTEDMVWLAAQGHTVVGVELAIHTTATSNLDFRPD